MNPRPKYVTLGAALAGLRRAVRERGEGYVCQETQYFLDNGWPACLVGHVFCYQGITQEDLELTAGPTANILPMCELGGVTRPYEYAAIFIQPDAVELLERVQVLQDNGDSWGEVLAQVTATNYAKEH